jgi:phosphoenolpyruvate-protein phosphotransferase (PTS system enzyme I)
MMAKKEIDFRGNPVSKGIAIGTLFFHASKHEEIVPAFSVSGNAIDSEIARYRRAIFSSREDLQRLQSDLMCEGSSEAAKIIDTHIQMLDDPLITVEIEKKIRQTYQNTESVFSSFIADYEKKFSKMSDRFFKQRLDDIIDLSKRILGHLRACGREGCDEFLPNTVLFAKELVPTDMAAVQTSSVIAFITEGGGSHSHTALIARAKGIPYVCNIDLPPEYFGQNLPVIVDGFKGIVIINPLASTTRKYRELQKKHCMQDKQLAKDLHLDAMTRDGHPISVLANVGQFNELDILYHGGTIDIGLLRTEYFFLKDQDLFPSEEEQYQLYSGILKQAKNASVVFRVFDFGGDKRPSFYLDQVEAGSLLSCRGIRYLLRYPEQFAAHLKAIFRSTEFGKIKLLLPMISDLVELRRVKKIIDEVYAKVLVENPSIQSTIPLGCMVEVPSAALICDLLLEECDFLSLGTNDLIQYTLGIDRGNSGMSDFQFPAHPSILRLIKMVAEQAKAAKKPMTICGDIASNSLFAPLLLGLGIESFSCPPRYIPVIKRVIRQSSLSEMKEIAEHALSLKTGDEVYDLLLKRYQDIHK